MMPVKDISSQTFGRLTVIGRAPRAGRKAHWICLCACGNRLDAEGVKLRRGNVRSCGCLLRDLSTKHGLSRSPEYVVWKGMRQRCHNPRSMSYVDYGARGITICERWNDFSLFLADMGPRPSMAHTIERLENNGNYEPANCIWATRQQQGKNTRRVRRLLFEGQSISINEIAVMSGYKPKSVATFLRSGRTIEQILGRVS